MAMSLNPYPGTRHPYRDPCRLAYATAVTHRRAREPEFRQLP
jgi:hypothetical protein